MYTNTNIHHEQARTALLSPCSWTSAICGWYHLGNFGALPIVNDTFTLRGKVLFTVSMSCKHKINIHNLIKKNMFSDIDHEGKGLPTFLFQRIVGSFSIFSLLSTEIVGNYKNVVSVDLGFYTCVSKWRDYVGNMKRFTCTYVMDILCQTH